MSRDEFSGKPPKTTAEIRRVLDSIHKVVEAPQAGPYRQGLPVADREHVATVATRLRARSRKQLRPVHIALLLRPVAYYRKLLLHQGGLAGGLAGFFLGLNLGLALPIILGQLWLLLVTPIVMALCGCVVGHSAAYFAIVDRRRDLFSPAGIGR
jgi:hypothetical protein